MSNSNELFAVALGVASPWSVQDVTFDAGKRLLVVGIDFAYATTQAVDRHDILNVGGFSDAVFEAVAQFAKGAMNANHWVGEIEKIEL